MRIEPTGLTRRIIPCLDVAAGRVVKGVQFKNLTDHGDPTEAAARYAAEGADEIVFLDITAAPERRDTDLDWVRRTAEQVFIPLSVGGGVRSVDDGRKLLLAGADKLGINTAAVAEPELLTRLAERFGSQCVVLSVDAKRREAPGAPRDAFTAASSAFILLYTRLSSRMETTVSATRPDRALNWRSSGTILFPATMFTSPMQDICIRILTRSAVMWETL